jgi:hypothetical protein
VPVIAATEALERQLQVVRILRQEIGRFNAAGTNAQRRTAAVDDAHQYANDIALLGVSKPMYWTRETARAVFAMSATFDLASITADRHLLFCDMAFCWFENPQLSISLLTGEVVPVTAVSWSFAASPEKRVPTMRVVAYASLHGVGPQPVAWTHVDDGSPLDSFPRLEGAGLSDAKHASWIDQSTQLFQFVVCAGAFLRQRIATAESVRADRHARKRIAAAGWTGDPLISIIHLRERERRESLEADAGGREYQWQWMVRAHSRQQWYPSIEKHLPILVGPYIKGPEDKPLKPRTTPVFLVNR